MPDISNSLLHESKPSTIKLSRKINNRRISIRPVVSLPMPHIPLIRPGHRPYSPIIPAVNQHTSQIAQMNHKSNSRLRHPPTNPQKRKLPLLPHCICNPQASAIASTKHSTILQQPETYNIHCQHSNRNQWSDKP